MVEVNNFYFCSQEVLVVIEIVEDGMMEWMSGIKDN